MAPARDISGTYASTFGPMVLHQQGNHVIGNYTLNGGQIDGTLTGNTLDFTWREHGGGAGFGRFDASGDGRLVGSWGVDDDHSSGQWEASQASDTVLGAGLAPSPFGDSKIEAGAMPIELYMPWDGEFIGGQALVGMGGLGVGLGARLTPNWYLGGTADAEAVMSTNDSGGMSGRIRAGAEARYIFGHGAGVGTVNDGPEFGVDRYTWIGMRAGVETLDEFTSRGAYADVSLGTAFALGHTQIGMYASVGLAVEPDSTLNPVKTTDLSTMPAPGGGEDVGPTVALGMIVTFGG